MFKRRITNPEDIKKYIRKDTALIVFTQASNVLGTIQPIKEIGKIAREKQNSIFSRRCTKRWSYEDRYKRRQHRHSCIYRT